ncbi:hypothetical protein B9K06_25380, partial [Bacillus sp. OG2]
WFLVIEVILKKRQKFSHEHKNIVYFFFFFSNMMKVLVHNLYNLQTYQEYINLYSVIIFIVVTNGGKND